DWGTHSSLLFLRNPLQALFQNNFYFRQCQFAEDDNKRYRCNYWDLYDYIFSGYLYLFVPQQILPPQNVDYFPGCVESQNRHYLFHVPFSIANKPALYLFYLHQIPIKRRAKHYSQHCNYKYWNPQP